MINDSSFFHFFFVRIYILLQFGFFDMIPHGERRLFFLFMASASSFSSKETS